MHVYSLFCLENTGFELDLGEISNLLCFASLKFHLLLARGICALNLSLYITPFWRAYLWKRMSFNILFDQSGSLFRNIKKKGASNTFVIIEWMFIWTVVCICMQESANVTEIGKKPVGKPAPPLHRHSQYSFLHLL